jgi:ComF family protein
VTALIPNPKSLIPRGARSAADGLVAALWAPSCAVCSTLLDEPTQGCVCRNCWAAIRRITPPLCDRCGDALPRAEAICLSCSESSVVTRARALGEYEGSLREIVHAFKYSGRQSLARPLAERLRHCGKELIADIDSVVPVPLHWRREYQRGFNQAREIARHLGPPVVDALVRRRATRAQVELAADRRRANVEGAFRLRRQWIRKPSIHGMRVLLIDDVSTTGATLDACARVLKDGGALEVFALTAARVVTRRRHRSNPQSLITKP